MIDTTYYPLSDTQLAITNSMMQRGGPKGLILIVLQNILVVSKHLTSISTDELIRALHEAERLAKTDPDYLKVTAIIRLWLNHKVDCINIHQKTLSDASNISPNT